MGAGLAPCVPARRAARQRHVLRRAGPSRRPAGASAACCRPAERVYIVSEAVVASLAPHALRISLFQEKKIPCVSCHLRAAPRPPLVRARLYCGSSLTYCCALNSLLYSTQPPAVSVTLRLHQRKEGCRNWRGASSRRLPRCARPAALADDSAAGIYEPSSSLHLA